MSELEQIKARHHKGYRVNLVGLSVEDIDNACLTLNQLCSDRSKLIRMVEHYKGFGTLDIDALIAARDERDKLRARCEALETACRSQGLDRAVGTPVYEALAATEKNDE